MKKEKSKKFVELCEKYGVDSANVPEILTYEDACKITKRNLKVERDAMQKTIVIIESFCKELKWKANYNGGQDKWFPVHRKTHAGLVVSDTADEGWYSDASADVGSPFVLPNADCAKFVGQHFLKMYSWKLKYKVK